MTSAVATPVWPISVVTIDIGSTSVRGRDAEGCGGAKEIRTPDLFDANEARYQLRHSPKMLRCYVITRRAHET